MGGYGNNVKKATIMVLITSVISLTSCGTKNEGTHIAQMPTYPTQTTVQPSSEMTEDETESISDEDDVTKTELSVTTTVSPSSDYNITYTTTAPSYDEFGYVYDKLESIPLNDMVLYDKDGIKVIGKEVLSEPLEIDDTLEGLSIVCDITNNSSADIDLNLREISINDAGLGWVNVYRTPSVKAGESTTGKFIIPVYSIIDHTGFNLGDIEKMKFRVTSVVNLKDNDGEPVEITFK